MLDKYLKFIQEQMKQSVNMQANQQPGFFARVRNKVAEPAGAKITNQKLALEVCYEKQCASIMDELEPHKQEAANDPIKMVLYQKLLAQYKKKVEKCKIQCYGRYLEALKKEEQIKVGLTAGSLKEKQIAKVKFIDMEIQRNYSKLQQINSQEG